MVKFILNSWSALTLRWTWLPGDLPATLTTLFKLVTSVIDPVELSSGFRLLSFLYKKMEAGWLASEIWSYMGFWLSWLNSFTKEAAQYFAFGQRNCLLFPERTCHGDSHCCWDLDYHCPATDSRAKISAWYKVCSCSIFMIMASGSIWACTTDG